VTEVPSLQQTLAAEHAAVYVFGVLGGRAASLPAPILRTALGTAYDVHVARRDQLQAMVTAAGSVPVPAEPAYALARDLVTAPQLAAAALRVERTCLVTYGALVAAGVGTTRRWAIDALGATAVAELGFGGTPEALPGLDAAGSAGG
jgi:hypothetical protein